MDKAHTILTICSSRTKILLAILFFFIGGMIYIVFRVSSLRMFSWANMVGLTSIVVILREQFGCLYIPDFVKYCLPDGFWLFSYLLIIDSIYPYEYSIYSIIAFCMLPVVAIGSEIMQIFGLLPGTFDIGDLICYIGAMTIFSLLKFIRV